VRAFLAFGAAAGRIDPDYAALLSGTRVSYQGAPAIKIDGFWGPSYWQLDHYDRPVALSIDALDSYVTYHISYAPSTLRPPTPSTMATSADNPVPWTNITTSPAENLLRVLSVIQ
jgi:hypothetical protein